MFAKITKDLIFDGDLIPVSREGVVVVDHEEYHNHLDLLDVRLYDDDGELYYHAVADDEALELLYSWAARDAGVTMLKVREGGEWKAVIC